MKALSIICYIIGSILLIVSCFTTSIPVTWWLGGTAVFFLIVGCVCQFNSNRNGELYHRHNFHN
ncbi:MAG: hypothetical protein K2J82_02445 [Muribaculaceae bacterium]|nr:hypothetical protein [Muribaculaceae bacterium]MDE6753451.1 hypothetical protein [Muribaculaceae bacterium]